MSIKQTASSTDQNYYILGPAVTNKADDWQSKIVTLETVSGTTHSHTFNSADEIIPDKDFMISNSADTSGYKNAYVESGNGVNFTGSGSNNIKYSLQANYTYPVTFTYDTNGNKLTGIATENSVGSTSYYVVGDDNFAQLAGINEIWENACVPATMMSGSGTTYTKSFTNTTGNSLTVAFKVTDGKGKWTDDPNYSETVPAGATLIVNYDSSKNAATFEVQTQPVRTYSVTVASAISSNVKVNKTTAAEGDTVTISSKVSGKVINTATVKDASGKSVAVTVSNGVATFTMPASNVTVTAATLKEGQSGTLSDKYFFVSNISDNPSGWNKSFRAYEDTSGIYYVRLTVEDLKRINNDFTGNYFFGISSNDSANNLYFGNNNTNHTDEYIVKKVDTNNFVEIGTQVWGGYYFARFNISSPKVTAITLKFKDNTDSWDAYTKKPKSVYTVEVEDNYVPFPTGGIKVYAKNGTACDGGTCNFGNTTVTGLESQYIDNQGKYKIYAAKKGERLAISTKLNDNYLKANFYVHSFCINGSNYPAVKDTTDTTGATYRINVPYVMGSEPIEITPIYYNTTIENNDDYVAVYFDSTALDAHWGNTVSAYSYYQDDSKGHAGCMDGAYPG